MSTDTTEPHKRFDAFDLCEALDNFIDRNRHSRYVNDRWLANYLAEARACAGFVRNNNLPEELRKRVVAFRCAEIAAEKQRKQLEIDSLDGEMRRLKEQEVA